MRTKLERQLENAADWVDRHQEERGLNLAITHAAWRFRVDDTDLKEYIRQRRQRKSRD